MRSFRDILYHMRRQRLQRTLPLSGIRHHRATKLRYKIFIALGIVFLWFISSLGQLRLFVPSAFTITGFPFWEKNYLILFQNNAELRPTGGFITNYGILTFAHGLPKAFEMYDVWGEISNHAYVEPPYPMKELLASKYYQGYTFRDANHNPDFPKTAEELLRFYRIEHPNAAFDGVFAFDLAAAEDIIGVFGKVSSGDITFTKENFFEHMEQLVSDVDRHNPKAIFEDRKQPLRDLGKTLMKKAFTSPFRLRALTDAIYKNLNEKHILLAFQNRSIEKKMKEKGWDGALASYSGADFLAVVESNLGGAKSDRYMDRNVKYAVRVQENNLFADLSVTLTHNGTLNPPISHAYKGYLRVYVPHGSIITQSPSGSREEPAQPSETLKSIGTIVRLEPGESIMLQYQYRLPPFIQQNRYSLKLWKQPGTINDNYEITLLAPQGKTWKSRSLVTREHVANFSGPLETDRLLSAELQEDTLPPRVIYQGTPALNEITIHFNEDLDRPAAEDGLNYSIEDANEKNPHRDVVRIEKVIVNADRYIVIRTNGMTVQPEERYKIKLRHLRDKNGNEIEPKEITVVQRFE